MYRFPTDFGLIYFTRNVCLRRRCAERPVRCEAALPGCCWSSILAPIISKPNKIVLILEARELRFGAVHLL